MSYILTFTGVHFDPLQPEERLLSLTDIGHALSLLCRANGHFRQFYSVGQHSIACALEAKERGYAPFVVGALLLHDASEAYLSDVTRPIKGSLTAYLEAEKRLQDMIYSHFLGRLPAEEEQHLIDEVDDDMLSLEFATLMNESLNDRYVQVKTGLFDLEAAPWEVERAFEQYAKECL